MRRVFWAGCAAAVVGAAVYHFSAPTPPTGPTCEECLFAAATTSPELLPAPRPVVPAPSPILEVIDLSQVYDLKPIPSATPEPPLAPSLELQGVVAGVSVFPPHRVVGDAPGPVIRAGFETTEEAPAKTTVDVDLVTLVPCPEGGAPCDGAPCCGGAIHALLGGLSHVGKLVQGCWSAICPAGPACHEQVAPSAAAPFLPCPKAHQGCTFQGGTVQPVSRPKTQPPQQEEEQEVNTRREPRNLKPMPDAEVNRPRTDTAEVRPGDLPPPRPIPY
jgi:hypothetical protein